MALRADQAEEAIQQHFLSQWNGQTPVAYDNVDFDSEKLKEPWVRLSIIFTAGDIASIGGEEEQQFRSFGRVAIQVFTVKGTNKVQNTTLCKSARNIFKGVQLAGGLWFRFVSIQSVGPDGKWYQQNVSAQFIYDEE